MLAVPYGEGTPQSSYRTLECRLPHVSGARCVRRACVQLNMHTIIAQSRPTVTRFPRPYLPVPPSTPYKAAVHTFYTCFPKAVKRKATLHVCAGATPALKKGYLKRAALSKNQFAV
jgi:hypothetical protein